MKTQNNIIEEEKKPEAKEKGRGIKKSSKPPKEVVQEVDQQDPPTDVFKSKLILI